MVYYDAIAVAAGSTDLVACKLLAENGVSVLLTERSNKKKLLFYLKEFNSIYGNIFRKSYQTTNVITKLNDNKLNTLYFLINGSDIIDFTNDKKNERVAKKLIRNPVLAIKIAQKIPK